MTNTNGQKPVGYDHDNKGAAGGTDYGQGKPGVAHTAPVDKVAGKGEGERAKTFTIDDREVTKYRDIHPGRIYLFTILKDLTLNARLYGADSALALGIVITTTAIGLVTIPAWLHFGSWWVGM